MTNHFHLLLKKSKKLNIATSTVSEFVTRNRQIMEERGLKLLEEDIK